jgi:hypothetical protein
MAATGRRKITVTYFGDVGAVAGHANEISAADNDDESPAQIQLITLASGNNTITVPAGGSTPVACTIAKPTDNATAITLKGVNGDTGIRLHDTDPDAISIDSSTTSFVIHAAAEIVGIRLFWT